MPSTTPKKSKSPRVPPAGEGDYTKARQRWNPEPEEVLQWLREQSSLLGKRKSVRRASHLPPLSKVKRARVIEDYTKAREQWNPSEEEILAAVKKRSKALKKQRKAS